MSNYHPKFVQNLASSRYLKPLSLAAGDGPDAAANAKFLDVLHAFMDPLAEFYQSLVPDNMPSDEDIKEQATAVAWKLVLSFEYKVRYSTA
jgi:hypothetical protein